VAIFIDISCFSSLSNTVIADVTLFRPFTLLSVPLAFNCADLVEKILWLKANPRRAERLASNARNFGASYLRTEDYYCYAGAALAEVAKAAAPSALLPFNAKLLPILDRFSA
jgi:Glycosyl transferase family 90